MKRPADGVTSPILVSRTPIPCPARDQSVDARRAAAMRRLPEASIPSGSRSSARRNRRCLRQDRHGLAVDRRAAAGGERELADAGRQTALGRVVQRGHPAGVEDGHRLRDDGDAGFGRKLAARSTTAGSRTSRIRSASSRATSAVPSIASPSSAEARPPGGRRPGGECARRRLAEQDADEDRPADRRRDLRVAADERDTAATQASRSSRKWVSTSPSVVPAGQEGGDHHPAGVAPGRRDRWR